MDLETTEFQYEPRMSDADALMWSIEKDPQLRSTIVWVSILDRTPDRERFERVMERATRVVPRLRQRVLGHPYSIAPPRWEVDPNFDLDYHLRWMKVIGAGTEREVFDLAAPIAMQGFDRARPLWEMTVVEGLEGDRAAIIGKVHHAITDGVGGVRLQMEMLDLERQPATEKPMPPAPEPEPVTERRRIVDAMNYEAGRQAGRLRDLVHSAATSAGKLVSDPIGVIDESLQTAASLGRLVAPVTEPLSPLMRDRSLSVHFDTIAIPLDELKAPSRVVAGRLNDAFVAGVAGGLRRYHAEHGVEVDALRMTMPINVRTEANARTAANAFVPARFAVPVGIVDPLQRMDAIRKLVAHQRAEPALALTDSVAALLNRLPTTATTAVFGSMLKGIDFITSNVPGAPVPVYVAGAKVQAQVALAPMTGSAANVTLLSHEATCHIGINVDPAAVTDPALFTACLRESFVEICKVG
ncbi:MAG: wax ester/triacylglycerol synthase family O-acyltransferase [Acidimicrobiales bacterium]|nr:wax ester/triacylglycerol synthase family O-acyltransferase [Acidimicrobiales bacterium]